MAPAAHADLQVPVPTDRDAAATSAVLVHRAMTAGRRSTMAFHIRRASS
jgi:hypothetical protein